MYKDPQGGAHREFLDLPGQRGMEADVLEEGGSETHAQAGLLALTVLLSEEGRRQ